MAVPITVTGHLEPSNLYRFAGGVPLAPHPGEPDHPTNLVGADHYIGWFYRMRAIAELGAIDPRRGDIFRMDVSWTSLIPTPPLPAFILDQADLQDPPEIPVIRHVVARQLAYLVAQPVFVDDLAGHHLSDYQQQRAMEIREPSGAPRYFMPTSGFVVPCDDLTTISWRLTDAVVYGEGLAWGPPFAMIAEFDIALRGTYDPTAPGTAEDKIIPDLTFAEIVTAVGDVSTQKSTAGVLAAPTRANVR